jgi:hypothetical protein
MDLGRLQKATVCRWHNSREYHKMEVYTSDRGNCGLTRLSAPMHANQNDELKMTS